MADPNPNRVVQSNTTADGTLEFTEQRSIDTIWQQTAVAAMTPLPPYVPPTGGASGSSEGSGAAPVSAAADE